MPDSIHSQFAKAIDAFLTRLESRQSAFAEHYVDKDEALRTSQTKRLFEIAAREEQLCDDLRASALERNQILQAARGAKLPTGSISELATALEGVSDNERRLKRIERVGQRAAELRRNTWSHWVVAQRSYAQYSALIDLIANRGKTAPTSSAGEGGHAEGSLMDASA